MPTPQTLVASCARIAAALVVAAPLAAPASAQQTPETLGTFLRDNIGLSREQVAAMERGDVVVKAVPSANDRDVTVFGIVSINISRSRYIADHTDIRRSLGSATRPQFGVFSDPPVAADLAALVVARDEAAALANCKPGDCSMKLPIEDIRTLRERIRWSSPYVAEDVSAYARERLLEYLVDYRARGDAAMAIFADRGNVSARAAFVDMLGDSPYVFQRAPSVARYLTAYPAAKLPDATEVFYWAQETLPRLRPIITITHQVVLSPPELPATTVIASKQIYANHYFEAGVEVTAVSDRATGSYLLTLRRYRFDNLPAGPLNVKGRATDALSEQLAQDLRRAKSEAERPR
jgi:hypothetical protein